MGCESRGREEETPAYRQVVEVGEERDKYLSVDGVVKVGGKEERYMSVDEVCK
jgi:hypothetical protein